MKIDLSYKLISNSVTVYNVFDKMCCSSCNSNVFLFCFLNQLENIPNISVRKTIPNPNNCKSSLHKMTDQTGKNYINRKGKNVRGKTAEGHKRLS